tara:strand:+ start:1197 stop:1415 length:219 start_codon:yes stop_codon:yes gene_type:complete
MPIIKNDRKTHSIVFVVNMLSFKSHQVSTGKVKYDAPKPSMRAVQAALVASTAILVPYQNITLAGMPKMMAA